MKLFRRDPIAEAEAAAARTRAEVERTRQLAELRREQEAADRAARIKAEQVEEAERLRRAEQRRTDRAERLARVGARLAGLRTVAPLLVVNGATIGGQLAYAYAETPADWPTPARVAVAIGIAVAAESVALYVGWHAHDALLAKAYSTAANLRRASYGIAGVMAAVNYSHFATSWTDPTALAVILGILTSLSPWLWGLHTRRAQHVQLLREDLVDETGAVFDPARRRAFPVRSWAARRWSIDHNVRDPREAWTGYNAERNRRRQQLPAGRVRTAVTVLTGQPLRAREMSGLDTVPDDVRALCDSVIAQARAARVALTVGAAATVRTAIPMASVPAPRLATPVATTTARSGHQAGHSGGHDEDDLMAMIVATHEERPVATRMAITSGQDLATLVASEPGQSEPAPAATTVAAQVAKPRGQRVTTAVAKPVAKNGSSHDRIKAIAKRRPKATEAEIAEAAGVSVSTVRRALGKKKS